MWDDFGGQAFHLLGVVEEQVELDQFGPCIRDLAQTPDAGRGRAVDVNWIALRRSFVVLRCRNETLLRQLAASF